MDTIEAEHRMEKELKFKIVGELKYAHLTVPVWQFVGEDASVYSGRFIRYDDLPNDLREELNKFQVGATIPFRNSTYVHDFEFFMTQGSKDKDMCDHDWQRDGQTMMSIRWTCSKCKKTELK